MDEKTARKYGRKAIREERKEGRKEEREKGWRKEKKWKLISSGKNLSQQGLD